jgi:spore germination protein YaaH
MLLLLLPACTPAQPPPKPAIQLKTVTLDNTVKIVAGQTVYVPIYSHIYTWEQSRTMNLTATLSVRNIDLASPMIIASVNYYDDNGKLIRNYLEQPVELGPLASASFVVNQEDTSGGSGAAFVVEWVARQQISAPVIEGVMINTAGNQGLSFISPGRVIKSRTDNK